MSKVVRSSLAAALSWLMVLAVMGTSIAGAASALPDQARGNNPALPISGVPLVGVTAANAVVRFNSATPGNVSPPTPISGLQAAETIVGIDFRPATGELYALGSTSRLYNLDPTSGVAVQVGNVLTTSLNGGEFGFDFNPTVDRIRLTSDAEQNLRLNPITGNVAAVDLALTYAMTDTNAGANPNVVASGYTNSFPGSTATTLYNIDSNLDILVSQAPPNNGVLNTIGTLGVDATDVAGFDITSDNAGFATFSDGTTSSTLYSINLGSGRATPVGVVGSAQVVVALAAMPAISDAYAVTTDNNLLAFNSGVPETILSERAITGLQTGESILGMDVRPANRKLYALGSTSRLYTIDPTNGAAVQVGGVLTTTLNGTDFGFDFNPAVDRIRVVSDADQNLRLNPDTGRIAAVDAALTYAVTDTNAAVNPNVVGAAYTNNFPGTIATTLYDIDSGLDILTTQSPPNNGVLNTVGTLGLDTTGLVGFDIAAGSNIAIAALNPLGSAFSNLYGVNLATGRATLIGTVGTARTIRDIALMPPVPDLYALTANTSTLLGLDSAAPNNLLSARRITGLQTGETVVGIDFRPATGVLYALGSTSRLYTVDQTTGAAFVVGTALTTTLNGTDFGFDFNPAVDRIRVVSDADQNLRLNPNTGTVGAVDMALTYAMTDTNAGANPNVVGAAYTNNFAGTSGTTLYDIDSNLDILVRQAPPNNGVLNTVGPLGVNTSGIVGFDIGDDTGNTAIAALTPTGATTSRLYLISLGSGNATLIGSIGGTEPIRDIAIRLDRAPTTAVALTDLDATATLGGSPLTLLGTLAVGTLVALGWHRRRTR